MSKSKIFKHNFNGRELDVWLVENKQKTTIKLDLYYNLEIRTPFKTVEEVIHEVGEKEMNLWFEKASEAQEKKRAGVFKNRKELKKFITPIFEKIKAEKNLDVGLVFKWLANEYSRVEWDKGAIVLNWANEIKSKEFVINQLNECMAEWKSQW